MKTMKVQVHINPEFYGESTPTQPMKLYKVVQVTNSIKPEISAELHPDELDVYCMSDAWNVTIV